MAIGSPLVLARAAILLLMAVLPAAINASAEPVEDFYKGKTISLVIGSGEGGGYDISGRLIAEFLPRFIPGRPVVIPRNMPGASGARAAEYIYNVAQPDGTVICIPQPTMLLDKVLDPAVRHGPQAFTWIGRLGAVQTFGVVWHAAPARSVEAAKTTSLVLGAAQGTGNGSNVVTALNRLVGTKFVLVRGYTAVSESGLAMERGEIQGISSASWEFLESKGWVVGKDIELLYAVGLTRNPKAPQTPTIGELASNNGDRDVLDTVASPSEIGRAVMAPPNIPAERAHALRDAFAAMVRDPDFAREAARRNVELAPLSGEALQRMVVHAMDVSPDVAERTRRAIRQ